MEQPSWSELITLLAHPLCSPTVQWIALSQHVCRVTLNTRPSGALWGAIDIQKMAQQGTLGSVSITMTKYPSAFKLYGKLHQKLLTLQQQPGESLLYDGPVRELCPMVPHNVNTIATAALATAMAPGLGFDGVHARLVTETLH